ncbi:MAG: hypothetical protein FJZ43_01730 [Candidatus Staskawiczbacteria bacterium]|nr:hypothetical protein [Candidatus Staskawiczbacteria bacterium]
MILIIIKLFLLAFAINLIYELLHSVLYKTCIEMTVKKYVPLIFKASIVDAVWITIFYVITFFIFKNENPLKNYYQLGLFFSISIVWAYFWEIYSTKHKRWEYSNQMPIFLKAGVTPLIQLYITGIIAFFIIFLV